MDGRGDGEGSLSKDVLGHQGVNALEDVDGSVNVLRVDAKVGFSGSVETRGRVSRKTFHA